MHAIILAMVMMTGTPYEDAIDKAERTEQPLLVVVGAEWCAPCRALQSTVIPEAQRKGYLDKVIYAHLDVDKDSVFAKHVQAGAVTRSVPVIALYRKVDDEWQAVYHIGYVTAEQLRDFIRVRME